MSEKDLDKEVLEDLKKISEKLNKEQIPRPEWEPAPMEKKKGRPRKAN